MEVKSEPNMALGENEFKDEILVYEAHFEPIPFVGEKERRKGEKS